MIEGTLIQEEHVPMIDVLSAAWKREASLSGPVTAVHQLSGGMVTNSQHKEEEEE